jgi:hypothetical protein
VFVLQGHPGKRREITSEELSFKLTFNNLAGRGVKGTWISVPPLFPSFIRPIEGIYFFVKFFMGFRHSYLLPKSKKRALHRIKSQDLEKLIICSNLLLFEAIAFVFTTVYFMTFTLPFQSS